MFLSCPFPSWFPSVLAPTDSAILSYQCFLQFPCTRADAFLANPFTVPTPTASVYTLTRYSNSISPSLSNPCPLPHSPLSPSLTSATSPYSVVAYPLSWGFTTSLSTTWAFGYSVVGNLLESFCSSEFLWSQILRVANSGGKLRINLFAFRSPTMTMNFDFDNPQPTRGRSLLVPALSRAHNLLKM